MVSLTIYLFCKMIISIMLDTDIMNEKREHRKGVPLCPEKMGGK